MVNIYENLCVHDPRNPFYADDRDENTLEIAGDCYCDNCFYGRHDLAVEILKLRDACQLALDEMCSIVAPSTRFTATADHLDTILYGGTNGHTINS